MIKLYKDVEKTEIRTPEHWEQSTELRFVAHKIQTGKYMIGMGRTMPTIAAITEDRSDEFYEAMCILDHFADSEQELTHQVMMLEIATYLIDSCCQCCGRPF